MLFEALLFHNDYFFIFHLNYSTVYLLSKEYILIVKEKPRQYRKMNTEESNSLLLIPSSTPDNHEKHFEIFLTRFVSSLYVYMYMHNDLTFSSKTLLVSLMVSRNGLTSILLQF